MWFGENPAQAWQGHASLSSLCRWVGTVVMWYCVAEIGQSANVQEEEAALERAENLMNAVCLGTYHSWDEIRTQLASVYTQGKRVDLAGFVSAC